MNAMVCDEGARHDVAFDGVDGGKADCVPGICLGQVRIAGDGVGSGFDWRSFGGAVVAVVMFDTAAEVSLWLGWGE